MTKRLSHPSAVLALAFLAAIAFGTLLLMLPGATASGAGAPWITALFTATSAVCVTGLVVVDTGSYWSGWGQAAILGLFQLGGFGIMTSATLLGLLVNRQLRLRSRLLLQAETHSLGLGDVKSVARLVLAVTVVVELAATLVLALRFHVGYGMQWSQALWHGLFHAVSAFNNAGFSTWSDSVVRFVRDAWVLVPLMLAIVIGGLGFPVLHETLMRRGPVRSIHTVLTLWGTAFLLAGGTAALLLAESGNAATFGAMDGPSRLLAAAFTSVSARTAGFNAVDIGSLTLESLNLHYLLMFIGGGSAGTAGGVKVTTFFVLLLIVWNEIRGHQDVEFRQRRVSTAVQRQALTILVLSAGAVVLATLALVPMTRLPYEKVLFEVISAFGTVGLSTGITAELPPAGQLILVALMYAGRVGVVTLAAAIAVNQLRRAYRYPEEKPIVG
ncbi:MAG: potassium transporter TrkG [Pseudomonadota bacterium]